MRAARIVTSCLFVISALLLLTIFVLGLRSQGSIEETIKTSREIEASFRKASDFVEGTIKATGVLPSKVEFDKWSVKDESMPRGVKGLSIDIPPFSSEFNKKHGFPPKNGYVISFWRGEWEENFISWTGKSTLTFEKSNYYMFGSEFMQGAFFVVLSCLLVVGSFKIWPKRNDLKASLRK
jgi:hypothetical protein